MVGLVIRQTLIMNKQIKNFILIFLYFFPICYILEIIFKYIYKYINILYLYINYFIFNYQLFNLYYLFIIILYYNIYYNIK